MNFSTHHILTIILVGLIAGWIAGLITRGRGFGIIIDIVLGIVGAFIGGYILSRFGVVTSGTLGMLFAAIIGAVILIVIVELLRKIIR